jgi:hypothetical protein
MELSLLESLEVPKPSHWPMPMARFGLNPYGEPLYRVVFAPSVRRLVHGRFADGYTGAKLRRSYASVGDNWILEKWISGAEDTRMTPAEYERYGPRDPQSGMLINGPYPYRGTYNLVHEFASAGQVHGVHLIIELIERGANRTPGEVIRNNRMLDERNEKEAAEKRFLRVRETEPLYGIRPASFAGRPKSVNHKSQRTPVSANQLGLPTAKGKVVAKRGPIVHANF